MSKAKKATGTRKTARSNGTPRPKKWKPPEQQYFDWRTFDPSSVRGTHADAMAIQLVTYRDNLDTLLRDEGKYVVIRGREIIGIYEDQEEALLESAQRFGAEPVLIKQIVAREPMITLGGVVVD